MSIYSLFKYIQYRGRAKSRHGVHSPFVYSFIETVLFRKAVAVRKPLSVATYQVLPSPYLQVSARIVRYFNCQCIIYHNDRESGTLAYLTAGQQKGYVSIADAFSGCNILIDGKQKLLLETANPAIDLLWIEERIPINWLHILKEYEAKLPASCIIAISSIHQSKAHSTAWKDLIVQSGATLSLDLFHIGLLFFRKEFKEPQTFVLKVDGLFAGLQ